MFSAVSQLPSYDSCRIYQKLPFAGSLPDAGKGNGTDDGDQPCLRPGEQQLFRKGFSGIRALYALRISEKMAGL